MRRLHVPRHVHWVEDQSGCLTLLNEHTGQWHLLNSTAAYTWRLVREGPPAADVLTALTARFPGVPHERIRDDFEDLVGDLALRGLLAIETSPDAGNTWNETSMAFEFHAPGRISVRQLVPAALALPIGLILSRVPFRWTARVIRSVKHHLPFPQATPEEADALAHAAQRVARVHPGRMACYENSLTILVAAVLSGRSVNMYLGTATDPRRFHAWIETDGRIVRVYPDPCPGEEYQRVIAL